MRSHDADRADLRIAGRSSRVLSHSDVLRLASACAPSFAGCLGLKLLFFSGASWHNITLRQTLSARKALRIQAPCPYTYRYLLTYPRRFLFPTSVSTLKPQPSESRSTTTPPSFLASESIVRSVFSSALVLTWRLDTSSRYSEFVIFVWDSSVVGRHQLLGYGLCLGYKMKEGGFGKLQKKMRGRFGDMVCE